MEKRTLESTLMAWPATDTLATAGIANLRELAENLRTRKAAHKEFNFSLYNSIGGQREDGCGTSGCAIGDLPLLRPDAFVFDPNDPQAIILRRDLLSRARLWAKPLENSQWLGTTVLSGMWWFRISEEMYDHLFVPLEYRADYDDDYDFEENTHLFQSERFGGTPAGRDATAEQVAANIEAFCDKVEAAWERIQADWILRWKGADHAL